MPMGSKEEQREYQRLWRRARRNKYLAVHGNKCRLCESQEDMEFDHIDRSKKVDHNIWSWTEDRIVEELSKCQLLCHRCHLEKTKKELYLERQHGTVCMYKGGGCRCSLCRKAHSDYRRLTYDPVKRRAQRLALKLRACSSMGEQAALNRPTKDRYLVGPPSFGL